MGTSDRLKRGSAVVATALGLMASCADDAHLTADDSALIRGRVTDLDGAPLEQVEVAAAGVKAHTDARGRFELAVARGSASSITVESDRYSSSVMPVSMGSAPVNVEVALKQRSVLKLSDAELGGYASAADGFAVTLPKEALRDSAGQSVKGEVEVRYTLINEPHDVTAAPGRMQTASGQAIEGYGLAEVRFYKSGKRVELSEPAVIELPLYRGHGLRDGAAVSSYSVAKGDARWSRSATASVTGDKVRLEGVREAWFGAAFESPVTSCVRGQVALSSALPLANTTVRAARARGLSLVQADTQDDGSFCMPVSPDDDWDVSALYAEAGRQYRLAVPLNSSNAAGMCGGGGGCKDVGAVTVPELD